MRSPQASLRLQQQLDLQLQIHDIGIVGTRGEEVARPLEFLGLIGAPAIPQVAAWLRRHHVQGPTLWCVRGSHRAARYLISHNQVDKDNSDIDPDTMLYLSAKIVTPRIGGHQYLLSVILDTMS